MDGSEDDAVYSDEIEDNNDSTRLTDDEGNDVYSRRKKRVLGILTISNLQTSEIYRS